MKTFSFQQHKISVLSFGRSKDIGP